MRRSIVLFTLAYPPYIGGAEVFVDEISRRLSRNFSFTIITARFSRRLPVVEERGGVTVMRVGIGHPTFDKLLYPLAAVIRALRSPTARRAAVVHGIMASFGGLAALWFATLIRRPLLITEQSGNLHTDVQHRPLARWWYRRIYRRAAAIHAISHFIERAIRHNVPAAAPITVIPNGVALDEFTRQAPVRRPPHSIVCVSRLSWEKGVADVLEAMPLVVQVVPDARLTVVGDGPERAALEALVERLGLRQSVQLAGAVPRSEIPQRLAGHDVFVCASHFEGLGNVFIEAQASGLPVVGTDAGGIPDVVESGVTGLLVPPHQPHRLAAALSRLLIERPLAERLAAAATARLARFSWPTIAQAVAGLYERVTFPTRLQLVVATGIFPPDAGGPATYTERLTRELPRRGIDVRVVSYADDSGPVATDVVPVRRIARRQPLAMRYLRYALAVASASRKAAGIFTQDPVSAGLPSLVAHWLTRRPLFVKIVGDAAWEYAQNTGVTRDGIDAFQSRTYTPTVRLLRFVQRSVCRSSRGVLVPSDYLKSIVHGWGIEQGKITVMKNAADVAGAVATPEEKRQAKQALGLEGHEVLVSVGRLVPWKGFDTLIGLAPDLRRQFPRLRVFILGSGPEERRLRQLVADAALESSVVLTGRLPQIEVQRYLKAADIFVLNTGYEGLPHVLLEAMAAATPVVSTTAGGNAEVIASGQAGLLVPFNDRTALLAALQRLFADADQRTAFASAAAKRLTFFSWQRLAPELISYFTSALA